MKPTTIRSTRRPRRATWCRRCTIVDDLGFDYGIYAGGAGRTGYITPQQPYPDANSPPTVTNVSPASGGIAGGTAITITGSGFTGATGVTVGGTAATAVSW